MDERRQIKELEISKKITMRKILIILLLVTASTTFAQLVKKGETEIFRF